MQRTLVCRIMRLTLVCTVWFVLTSQLLAVGIKGETKYLPYRKIKLQAVNASAKSSFLWDVDGTAFVEVEEINDTCYVWAEPGRYKVKLIAIDFDSKKIERASFTFTIDGSPDPGPIPPDPIPPPGLGKRVLMVYETSEATKLPEEQKQILYSRIVRDYLNSKCEPDSDGKTKAWRIWDKDVDASAEDKRWQDALKRERKSLPWIIITDSTGKPVYEGPLPSNINDAMTLFKKHLGG